MIKKGRIVKKAVLLLFIIAAVGAIGMLAINFHVKHFSAALILTPEQAAGIDGVDCIIVLGAKVYESGKPSSILQDRLDGGITLCDAGVSSKILMSGDHGRTTYNEVMAMKKYAMDANIPSANIFMDHAGFSTYETMYRAKEVFCVKKAIIVTQKYHLHRSLYIANKLGIEAYGVPSDYRVYGGRNIKECREILARFKDFFKVLFKLKPTYLGEQIPISGSGDLTNDY